MAPGEAVDAYAYNGQVPGPTLRVTEGDTVRVRVVNALADEVVPHNIPGHNIIRALKRAVIGAADTP